MNLQTPDVIGLLTAAIGGLAVGLEREWSGHAIGPHSRFAGVRTFTLLGILAGLSGWLWGNGFQAPSVILLIGAAALVVSAYIAASRNEVDGTTEVAALVVLAAGFTAALGGWALAGGVITVTTLLLVEKSRLHDIARRMDDTALRAAVRFGVMAVVILPLLPEGPFGPWGGIRPRTLWLAVLMFSGLSFFGYLARRSARGLSGYPVTGMLGGILSSTAVAFSFSRVSRSEPGQDRALALGVIGASTVLFLRVAVATSVLNPALALVAIPYFALPFAAGAAITAGGIWWNKKAGMPNGPASENPLHFWNSVQMAGLFQCVLYLVHGLSGVWGNNGLLASGAIVGLTDVDALAVSMARGQHGGTLETAAQALVIGILSNTVLKAGIVIALGRGRFRWLAVGGFLVIAIAIGISLVFLS
jgi:uncharacterized membrane protein (DUF4010 family)